MEAKSYVLALTVRIAAFNTLTGSSGVVTPATELLFPFPSLSSSYSCTRLTYLTGWLCFLWVVRVAKATGGFCLTCSRLTHRLAH